MMTQNLSTHVLLITLPAAPQMSNELEALLQAIRPGTSRSVIVDFSLATTLPLALVSNLLNLELRLSNAGGQLVLCSVAPAIMDVFKQVGLHRLFQYADNDMTARQWLDRACPREQLVSGVL